jgi:hypothetical protein
MSHMPDVVLRATDLMKPFGDVLAVDQLSLGVFRVEILGGLGPSTPLCPGVFAGTPVTLLSGVVVCSPDELMWIVSEGGGMQCPGRSVHKVTIRLGAPAIE